MCAGANGNVPLETPLDLKRQKKDTTLSSLGPVKDGERQDLNCAVKEYLLLAGYRLTAMTFYEEVIFLQENKPFLGFPFPALFGCSSGIWGSYS